MSSRKFTTRDPIYAAFLIFKGCKLLTIKPYYPQDPKEYVFEGSDPVVDGTYYAEFIGAVEQGAKTTWLDFKNRMENLQAKEDRLFRHFCVRTEKSGEDKWAGQDVFVTSSQAVAAFLLSRNVQPYGAREIRKGNHLFAFRDQERCNILVNEMLDGDTEDTWYFMKEKHKQATSLRIHFCNMEKKKRGSEPQRLRASGTNG